MQLPGLGSVSPGPVLTVVRNTQTGKIYVGLNIRSDHDPANFGMTLSANRRRLGREPWLNSKT